MSIANNLSVCLSDRQIIESVRSRFQNTKRSRNVVRCDFIACATGPRLGLCCALLLPFLALSYGKVFCSVTNFAWFLRDKSKSLSIFLYSFITLNTVALDTFLMIHADTDASHNIFLVYRFVCQKFLLLRGTFCLNFADH